MFRAGMPGFFILERRPFLLRDLSAIFSGGMHFLLLFVTADSTLLCLV
ncbi:hypothetical protein ACFOGG_05195 [Brenneria rubrifaciens]